jgi:hypothetical protein
MSKNNIDSETQEQLGLRKLQLEVEGLSDKVELEKKKLELEVDVLRHGFRRTLATALITALVSVGIAGGGWLIQRRSERAADARAERNHREEVFAKVLENFGSSNPSERMSAAVALSSFARPSEDTAAQTLAALANRLAVEDDLAVQEQIINSLTTLGKPGLAELVKTNRRAAMQFARESGQYVGLTTRNSGNNKTSEKAKPEEESKALLTLSRRLNAVGFPLQQDYSLFFGVNFTDLLKGTLRNRYNWSKRASLEGYEAKDPSKMEKLIDDSWDSLRHSTRFLEATSVAIERALQNLNGQLRGADLNGITLLFGHLDNLDLRGISFQGSFLSASAEGADLSFCDFTRARVECYFAKAKLRGATLTQTLFTDLSGQMGYDEDKPADLTGANWWDSKERVEDKEEFNTPEWMEKDLPRASQETKRQELRKDWESQGRP